MFLSCSLSQEPAQDASEQESESEESLGDDDDLEQGKDDGDGEDEEDGNGGDGGEGEGGFGGVGAMAGSLLSWAGKKETKSKTRGIRRDDSPIEVSGSNGYGSNGYRYQGVTVSNRW